MRKSALVCLSMLAVFAAGIVAHADEDARQAAIARLPDPPPGPAFPEPTVDMVALCQPSDDPPRFYPPRALDRNMAGDAVLDCEADDQGRLTQCQVLYEHPAGFQFGEAATRIACRIRLTQDPQSGDWLVGRAPQGARAYRREGEDEPYRARVPVRFRLR